MGRCGWSVIGGCAGCALCQAQDEEDEYRKMHCHFCAKICSDEDSEGGARPYGVLTNEHITCREKYEAEKGIAPPKYKRRPYQSSVVAPVELPSNVIPFRRRRDP